MSKKFSFLNLRGLSFMMVVLWAILVLLPTFLPSSWMSSWPAIFPQKTMVLGLDLRGGVHLVLEIDDKTFLKENQQHLESHLRKALRKDKIAFRHFQTSDQDMVFSLVKPEDESKVTALFKEFQNSCTMNILHQKGPKGETLKKVRISISETINQRLLAEAQEKSLKVIRQRIDPSGTKELSLQAQGKNRLVLQIPGSQDPAQVRQMLGKTAKLSFRLVASRPGPQSDVLIEDRTGRSLPVEKDVAIPGEDIKKAAAIFGQTEMGGTQSMVTMEFTPRGAHRFSDLTRDNIGRALAIVLDNTVLSAPTINGHIVGHSAQITGQFTLEEAQQLALLINSGALPAPLTVLEEKVVGPSLGHDSIVAGTRATLLAITLVALWMISVYSGFGVFSVLGIGFNLVFLMAGMILMGATLTLPGLAGIALTVGISVDANVLINERIKEELTKNQGLFMAIHKGYDHAMKSILDSNLTTLIGSLLLYYAGSGPVKGFAITMALGILISLFTSTLLTRWLVQGWISLAKPAKLWI